MGKTLYNSTLRLAVFGMLILSSFFLFNACSKDALIDDENPSGLISYNWGEKDRSFFNFSNVSSLFKEKVGLSYRNSSDTLPQLLVDAYNQLALENETHNFAERLSARVGVPFWSYSYVNVDESIEGGLIITPVGFVEGNKTTALLIASKSNQYPDNKFDFKLVLRKDIEKTIRDQNFTERPNLILEIGHLIYDDINIYNTFDNNFMDFLSANKTTLKNIYNANKLSYRDCVIYKFKNCFGIVVPYGENTEGSNNEGDTSGNGDWGGFGWGQGNNGGWTIPDKSGGEGVITPYIENFWKTFFDLYIRNLWQPNMVIERKDVQNNGNKTKVNSQMYKINLRTGDEDCWIFYIKKCSDDNGLFEEVLLDEKEQCEMALENFSYQYDLTLSQAETDYLQQNIPSYFCYDKEEYEAAAMSLYLQHKLNLTNAEKIWLDTHLDEKNFLFDYVRFDSGGSYTSHIANSFIDVKMNGAFYGPFPEGQEQQYIDIYNFPDPAMYAEFIVWTVILKSQWQAAHPGQVCGDWCNFTIYTEAYFKTMIGAVHTALDLCGLTGFQPCDLVNGVIFTFQGDGLNASLSYLGAIPLIGEVAIGTKLINAYKVGNNTFELVLKIGANGYEFGERTKLARLLQPAANEQCHHLITWASNNHEIIQLAAQKGWHPSNIMNGINLNKTIHNNYNAAHQVYNLKLTNYLNSLKGIITDPNEAKAILQSLQTSIRHQLENGKLLDQITFP